MISDFSSTISMGIVWSLRQAQRSPATVLPARDRNAMLVDKRERHEPLRDKAQTSLVHSGPMILDTL